MNPILKALLIGRFKEQGFAIPFVIALGLIMVLLGTISIIKSQDENLTAITQRKTSQALSAAEAGVARYVEFLEKNSAIASYGYSNNWTTLNTCDNLDATAITNMGSSWQTTPGYSSYGYKLVSYQYSATNATLPDNNTFGTLKIDARTPLGNSYAISRVSVQVPVRPESIGSSYSTATGSYSSTASYSLNPALWIGGSAANNFGNLKVSYASAGSIFLGGNLIVSRPKTNANPCNSTGFATSLLQDSTRQLIIADPRIIPNTPNLPPQVANNSYMTITPAQLVGATLPDAFGGNLSNAIVSFGGSTYYHYLVNGNLDLAANQSFSVRAGSKVILYVNGNITLGANSSINNPNSSAYLEIYGNSVNKYGATNTTAINFNGNTNVKAFIHAPLAVVNATGSPTINVTGAMWVDQWSGTVANNSFITPDITNLNNTSYQSSIFYTTTSSSYMTSKPLIYPPTQWTTEETN